MPYLNFRRHKDGVCKQKKKTIQKCQNEAWMSVINMVYENCCVRCSDNNGLRMCVHHFHSSVIMCYSKDNYELKISTSPTMNLIQFSVGKESYKEESSLSRIVGSTTELQHIHNYYTNNSVSKNTIITSIITPTRESRNEKRNYEMRQDEEAKKTRKH